ncbi:MAG TPA: hypothetical protein DCP20_06695 [Coriobacteriia bacterium]|nr:MAG: hypothetical protein XD74_0274 [Actinobacteria bacterium 66_15]HAL30388.1 hypothetical protein [Coriobacteriia bacterium]
MRIAVVQHAVRPAPAQDLEALVGAVVRAGARGAEWVVLPEVPAVAESPLNDELWRRLEEDAPRVAVTAAYVEPGESCSALDDQDTPGVTAILTGDSCFNPETLACARAHAPGVLVLAPHAESDIQAEATLEFAIALSTSLASLVIVVGTDGADPGEPGHGGSAAVYLGEVLAEALTGDDVLYADVDRPVGPPESPDPMPQIPPLLAQRVASHQGRKLEVDYPADLG